MKKLLCLKADIDVKALDIAEYTPLHYASERGHESVVKKLLDERADIDAQGRDGMSSLHLAAKLGHFKVVRLLLQRRARVEIHDNARRTPLHWAAYCGRHGVVELLLQNNASIAARDDYERTPLLLAALGWKNDGNRTVRKLLEWHADKNTVDRDGSTALHLAAEKRFARLVEFLLDGSIGGKPDIEALDINGRTPLHTLADVSNII
ncbi:ankyrin, partial [Wilcoxina mikolae CBS 423.85]